MKNIDYNKYFKIFNKKGFSFLELMVVVVILGILATYIAPRFMDRTEDAKAVKAKVDIAAIETSLKLYRLDNGYYPTTEQGLLALIEKPSTEPIPLNWKEKGYLAKARLPTAAAATSPPASCSPAMLGQLFGSVLGNFRGEPSSEQILL